jgi:hypothetical protein
MGSIQQKLKWTRDVGVLRGRVREAKAKAKTMQYISSWNSWNWNIIKLHLFENISGKIY